MLFDVVATPVIDNVPWAPIVAAVAQFPLIALFFIALNRGWIEIGAVARRERSEKDAQLAFREQLRQEGIKREEAGLDREDELVDKLGKLADASKETADVMERSTSLNERLVDGRGREQGDYGYRDPASQPRGSDRRASSGRPAPGRPRPPRDRSEG